jgi:hypothetical protein
LFIFYQHFYFMTNTGQSGPPDRGGRADQVKFTFIFIFSNTLVSGHAFKRENAGQMPGALISRAPLTGTRLPCRAERHP